MCSKDACSVYLVQICLTRRLRCGCAEQSEIADSINEELHRSRLSRGRSKREKLVIEKKRRWSLSWKRKTLLASTTSSSSWSADSN
jgi:hypothetical protein